MQFSVSGWCTFIFKKELCLLLISAIILFEALSVGMVVNAFGHANELQLTTLRPKLNSQSPTPLFRPVKLLDYLTYFDKIDGAADIMIIFGHLDTLNPQSRLERLMHGLFGCPSARQTA